MKKLIKKFFYWIKFRRKAKRFTTYNSELLAGIKQNRTEKKILKSEIRNEVKKFLKIKANSQYISRKRKNRAEIILFVNAKFGSRMTEQGIKIKNDLTLCDI